MILRRQTRAMDCSSFQDSPQLLCDIAKTLLHIATSLISPYSIVLYASDGTEITWFLRKQRWNYMTNRLSLPTVCPRKSVRQVVLHSSYRVVASSGTARGRVATLNDVCLMVSAGDRMHQRLLEASLAWCQCCSRGTNLSQVLRDEPEGVVDRVQPLRLLHHDGDAHSPVWLPQRLTQVVEQFGVEAHELDLGGEEVAGQAVLGAVGGVLVAPVDVQLLELVAERGDFLEREREREKNPFSSIQSVITCQYLLPCACLQPFGLQVATWATSK